MSSTLVKAGIGLAGVTTIGGGVTAAYLINNKEVEETRPSTIPSEAVPRNQMNQDQLLIF
ncbi:hypothetical protein A6V39_00885 [Candidatus Mycoplasma haematobovis]|uniref:Uncharacterized protein n=1 Tax=Candidatus Mycoplasma haematobovis TaxID=432608 RepID=A0A1A9QDR0_9MOLU|nr:hypothetical protein [Candidatus Mycoplasma haematobovis]OAL10607.1 hypothetical protein A6V39_00885 [Candidatus Mycoplasma haematobovis]